MKNIFLILCGVIIAFASLEILLQTSSFIIIQANKIGSSYSEKILQDKKFIKILCIGESTTFSQYPRQLTDYLNRNITKDFVVIDCGVPGTNILNIVDRIDKQIKIYNPDIVVSMMGVNDAQFNEKKVYKQYKLKIVTLFMLIKNHLENIAASKLYANEISAGTNYSKIVDDAFLTGKEPTELINFVKTNPDNIKAVESLVCFYRMKRQYHSVEKYANMLFENNIYTVSTSFMMTDIYIQQQNYTSAVNLILKIIRQKKLTGIELDDYFSRVVESYLSFSTIEHLSDFYTLLTENKIQSAILDDLYNYLKVSNANITYYAYYNKYKNINKIPNFNTKNIRTSYLIFADKLINKNITYICMGYPTISINKFKIFFDKTKFKNKIIFVSNEINFKETLKYVPYYNVFKDSFGGTFGHCTDYGNELIAENVGKIITELVN